MRFIEATSSGEYRWAESSEEWAGRTVQVWFSPDDTAASIAALRLFAVSQALEQSSHAGQLDADLVARVAAETGVIMLITALWALLVENQPILPRWLRS